MHRTFTHILSALCTLALLLVAAACDVHEFPENGGEGGSDRVPFVLNLDFTGTMEMGFHKEIDYSKQSTSLQPLSADAEQQVCDVRYTVHAYRVDANGNTASTPDTVITHTKQDISNLNYSMVIPLEKGTYKFLVWADYVTHGTTDDLYYRVADFKAVTYPSADGYVGCDDYRDAFRGEKDAAVTAAVNADGTAPSATVVMERPLAKFKFISTDLDEFLTLIAKRSHGKSAPQSRQELLDAISRINVADYKVVFRYAGFMPCSFNVWTNKPNDSWTGIHFNGRMEKLSDTESQLGFDYVMVNGKESTVAVAVYIYDRDGILLSNSDPIDVPLKRNKLTVVRGRFLLSRASGGVGISNKFDGEYDYVVQ